MDSQPTPHSNLTPEQWTGVPQDDHATLFSRVEVRAALALLLPPEEIPAVLDQLYPESPEPGSTFFFGDLLTALALGSKSAGERVRAVLNETEEEAAARIAAFRQTHPEA